MRSSRETSFRPDFGGANFTAHSTDQAVLYDPLTPLFDQVTAKLASLMGRDDAPNAQGSSHIDGWYGYVDKDLRGQFATHYCAGLTRRRARSDCGPLSSPRATTSP